MPGCREKSADLFVVCDYGQILSRETLAVSHSGGINLHASLLPKYRGTRRFIGPSITAPKPA